MKASFKKLFYERSSLLRHIGDQELPNGKKIAMYNSKGDHGELKKDSTYLDSTLKKKGYLRDNEHSGGLSDGMSVDDIANKHGISYDHIVKQLMMGKDIEMEHTDNEKLSQKIAMDHLVEDPNYYTKLKKMEG